MYYNPSAAFFQIQNALFIIVSYSVELLHAKDFCGT